MPDETEERVGRRVRRLRRAAGLSQAELAERAEVSRQAVTALEAGRHLPRVDAALALARALGTTVEDLLETGPPRALPVLDEPLVEGQAVRAARVGDHTVCLPVPARTDGEAWQSPDAVIRDGRVVALEDTDLHGFVIAGCDPALGIVSELGPHRGAGRVLPVVTSSGAARTALTIGRAHAAIVHDVEPPSPGDERRIRRLPLATWRTGIAAPADARTALAEAMAGRGPVVQRSVGATAQLAYERALERAGCRPPRGPRATGHLGAARRAIAAGVAAVTIEPVALALGLAFHPLETHRVEIWVDAAAIDHPGGRLLAEAIDSRRFRDRLHALPGYELGWAS